MRRSLASVAWFVGSAAALWTVVAPPLPHTHGASEEMCAAGLVASADGSDTTVWLPTRLLPDEPCAACATGPGSPAAPSSTGVVAKPLANPLHQVATPSGREVWTPSRTSTRSPPQG
ncbi:MAG: hypothetical protein HXY19_07005 [Thermoanaerobaculaceae bacterium]|nr:hypothetical protein [Thermoanaerobaculaceae bacterium]